jgi:hypothetical protein
VDRDAPGGQRRRRYGVKKERAGDILLYGSIYGSGALVSTLTLKRVETSSTGVTMLVCEPAS